MTNLDFYIPVDDRNCPDYDARRATTIQEIDLTQLDPQSVLFVWTSYRGANLYAVRRTSNAERVRIWNCPGGECGCLEGRLDWIRHALPGQSIIVGESRKGALKVGTNTIMPYFVYERGGRIPKRPTLYDTWCDQVIGLALQFIEEKREEK